MSASATKNYAAARVERGETQFSVWMPKTRAERIDNIKKTYKLKNRGDVIATLLAQFERAEKEGTLNLTTQPATKETPSR